MSLSPAPMLRGASPGDGRGPAAMAARLRLAALDFMAAWSKPRPRWRNETLRVFEGLGTLAFIASFVVIGALYDAETTRRAAKLSPETITTFRWITTLGLSGWLFAITGLVAIGGVLARGRGYGRRMDVAFGALAARGFYLFVVLAASGLCSQALKHLFGRARPSLMEIVGPMHFEAFALSARFASFPSGHTVTAFAMATGLGFMAPRLRAPLFFIAILVAASRVVIGAHYLSDVIAGAGLGYGAAVLARRAFAARRIVFEARDRKPRLRGAGVARWLVARARSRRA